MYIRTFDADLFKPLADGNDNPDYCCELSLLGYAEGVVPDGFFIRLPGEGAVHFSQPAAHCSGSEMFGWSYSSTSGDIAVLFND